VPGEGVEPSRAEAHGFLRPARLPIPPSRPGRSRVAGRALRTGFVPLLVLTACTGGAPAPGDRELPTVVYLFDGSPADAELVTAPALAGLELAAHRTGAIEIEPLNVDGDLPELTAALLDVAEDPAVVAAVIAPWTVPPSGAIDLLATHRLPVMTLSWAWGPPAAGDGAWVSFVADRAREAVLLLSAADVAPDGASICLAGDGHPASLALLETAAELGRAAGDPDVVVAGSITGADGAGSVAEVIADAGCPVLAWSGGAPGVASALSRSAGLPSIVVGPSRVKTDDGLAVATTKVDVLTVCACVDVTQSLDPLLQRFVHDLQAESGSPPGPFTVEAFDAGQLVTSILTAAGGDDPRAALRASLDDPPDFEGLAGPYTFDPDGSRAPGTMAVGVWRAAGSRWLPVERSTVPPS
jgi:hypothetical protein